LKIKLADLEIDPTVQIRRSNHEPTIRRYQESFEKLPPIDVFKTPEGLLLADGFHRTAAAQRLGLDTIEATVHHGSRADALEFAVVANTKNADPLTPEERDDGIRRLKQLHPDWAMRRLAEAMSVSQRAVQRVFDTDKVKRAVVGPRERVTDVHFAEVSGAQEEHWESLVKAADERGWTRDATRLAVKNLKDDNIPTKHKRDLLAGDADPVLVTPNGEYAVPADIVGGRIKDMAANDAILAFHRALEHLSKARLFKAEAIFRPANADTLEHWAKEIPGNVEFLEEILAGVRAARGGLRVISKER